MFKLATLAASAALALAATFGAQAATTAVAQSDQWYQFAIDDFIATSPTRPTEWIDDAGDTQTFTFTLASAAWLRVIDAGHAGDRFNVIVNNGSGATTFQTGAATDSFPDLTGDFDAAWNDTRYSRLATLLAPGTYAVTGDLLQAAGGGAPLNVTSGALMITAVPEPGTWAMFIAGFALLGSIMRRRT